MNLNPLVLLDILLADLVPAKGRRIIHNFVLLVIAVVALWLAADKDWWQAVLALIGAVYAASNRANTPDEDETLVSRNEEIEDDKSERAPTPVTEDEIYPEPETGTYGDYQ